MKGKIKNIEDAPEVTEQVEEILPNGFRFVWLREAIVNKKATIIEETFVIPWYKVRTGRIYNLISAMIVERTEKLNRVDDGDLPHFRELMTITDRNKQNEYSRDNIVNLSLEIGKLGDRINSENAEKKRIKHDYLYRIAHAALDLSDFRIQDESITEEQREVVSQLFNEDGTLSDFWLDQDIEEVRRVATSFRVMLGL